MIASFSMFHPDDDDQEREIRVKILSYDYDPGVMYLRDGSPGHPPSEDLEWEAFYDDTGQEIDYDDDFLMETIDKAVMDALGEEE